MLFVPRPLDVSGVWIFFFHNATVVKNSVRIRTSLKCQIAARLKNGERRFLDYLFYPFYRIKYISEGEKIAFHENTTFL